ncbi:MAG: hypothetical protein HY823_07980 [Acidobacteria bacterium]|nr:hypothetical protein [Acidobacteriota bacterium]
MLHLNWKTWLLSLSLGLLVGCFGGSGDNGSNLGGGGNARVTVQASYEKQTLSSQGLGAVVNTPARYAYVEIRQVSNNSLLANGYLGSDGSGYADLPSGVTAYVRVFAAYEIPSTNGGSFFMRGSVVNEPYNSSRPFEATSDWYMDSSAITVNTSGTLTVRAPIANRLAGAFNIADRAVDFGMRVRDLEPSLRLPNLHTYWTTSSNPNDQTRTYPVVLMTKPQPPQPPEVVKSGSGRAIFTHAVYGLQGGAAWTEQDEWDDGALLETFGHLLFANYSYQPDGSSFLSLLRLDNENTYVSRYRPSEASVAFAGGFCDFFAGASLNSPLLLDSYLDANRHLAVEAFDLSRHDQVDPASRTEFTRGSVAVSLWGIWKNAFGGSSTGLASLWQAVRSNTLVQDGTGEYNAAALSSFPTYLTGLKARNPSAWSAVVGQLQAESIPEPTATYFSGLGNNTRLWINANLPSGTLNGSIPCYPGSEQRYYDYAQAWPFRFSFSGAPRTVTVTMNALDNQDFELDVIGPQGWFKSSYDGPYPKSTRTLTLNGLTAGAYVVRVRANPDAPSTAGSYRFNLTIN